MVACLLGSPPFLPHVLIWGDASSCHILRLVISLVNLWGKSEEVTFWGDALWGLAGRLSSLNEVQVPRKFWLLAILPHTDLFSPRAHVGFCPGLPSPSTWSDSSYGERRERRTKGGLGRAVRCCAAAGTPSPSSLQDLRALPAVSLGWSVFDPQIRTSSQSSKPFPMALDSPSGGPRRLQERR